MVRSRRQAPRLVQFACFVTPLVLTSIAIAAKHPAPAHHPTTPAYVAPSVPDACYIIFPNEADAASACPSGIPAVHVFDFWSHQLLGWGCDCKTPN